MSPLELFQRAKAYDQKVISGVKPEQWTGPTNTDWDARGVVNHIITGTKLAVENFHGRAQTHEEAAAWRGRDYVGNDPAGSYDAAIGDLEALFRQPEAMGKMIKLPFMPAPIPGAQLMGMRAVEMVSHGWDLAHSTGQDVPLDADMCQQIYDTMKPMEPMLRASEQFGPHIPVPDDAPIQQRMLALVGRKA